MRPEDIRGLHTPGRPTLHPDGHTAVLAVTRPDPEADDYVGQLWSVALDGGAGRADGAAAAAPRRLTRGHRDTAPQFSPDGRLVAFLRAAPHAPPQLHVVLSGGGEPLALTDAPLGVGEARWSPDGTRLVYPARLPEPGRYGTADGVGPEAEPPRLVTDLRYQFDGTGYVGDQRRQLFVVTVPDPDAEPAGLPDPFALTTGDCDADGPVWSPDGRLIAFVSARHPDRARDLVVDAFVCDPDGGGLTAATPGTLTVEEVAWATDSGSLWLRASDPGPRRTDAVATQSGLFSVPLPTPGAGPGRPVRRTDPSSLDLGEVDSALTVLPTGVLVQARARGAVHLLRVSTEAIGDADGGARDADPGAPVVVLDGPLWVTGHDAVATAAGEVVVATVASAETVGELVAVEPGGVRWLTDFGAALRDRAVVAPLREVSATAPDGYPVHGWVVLPTGAGPHPLLLDIHGGPFTQHGWRLWDEAQVLAGAGYAVLLANPRGSAGYGYAHGAALRGAFGEPDTADVLALLDGVLSDPALPLDPRRLGVLGGSYGGYLTAWLTTRAEIGPRFAAAVVERGFLDPESFAGTSDIGWFFGQSWVGTDPDAVAAQSPMAAVAAVTTPTLVIHSERDLRCPLEQGQRWFAALQSRGVPSELLIFPGESHGLTRTGRPRHRVARFEHLLRWWARHLPTPANAGPADPGPADPGSAEKGGTA